MENKRILRLPAVKQAVGLGRTAIYEKIKAGDFPQPISLGARAVGWLQHEIFDWVDSRVTKSRNAA